MITSKRIQINFHLIILLKNMYITFTGVNISLHFFIFQLKIITYYINRIVHKSTLQIDVRFPLHLYIKKKKIIRFETFSRKKFYIDEVFLLPYFDQWSSKLLNTDRWHIYTFFKVIHSTKKYTIGSKICFGSIRKVNECNQSLWK